MSAGAANAICEFGETLPSVRMTDRYGDCKECENKTTKDSASLRDARKRRMRFVKNDSGGALLPGQIVAWKTLQAGKYVTNPAAATTAIAAGVVDPWLPAAGVANGEGFWIVVDGPTKFLNDAAGAIQEFDLLVVSASVAGCIREQTAAPAQNSEIPQVNGLVGMAEEAANAGGGALATATSFWGVFRAPFATH